MFAGLLDGTTFGVYHNISRKGGWGRDASKIVRYMTDRKDVPKDVNYYKLLLKEYTYEMNTRMILKVHTEMMGAGFALDFKSYHNIFHRFKHAREACGST